MVVCLSINKMADITALESKEKSQDRQVRNFEMDQMRCGESRHRGQRYHARFAVLPTIKDNNRVRGIYINLHAISAWRKEVRHKVIAMGIPQGFTGYRCSATFRKNQTGCTIIDQRKDVENISGEENRRVGCQADVATPVRVASRQVLTAQRQTDEDTHPSVTPSRVRREQSHCVCRKPCSK